MEEIIRLTEMVKLPCAGCEEYDVKPTIYTYRELQNATRNFDESMKLGQGGYGAVYKVGTIDTS